MGKVSNLISISNVIDGVFGFILCFYLLILVLILI